MPGKQHGRSSILHTIFVGALIGFGVSGCRVLDLELKAKQVELGSDKVPLQRN
jgi:hypothetical protein